MRITHALVERVEKIPKLDWTQCESVRADLWVIIKRILRRYGYPPDKQAKATELVLEQVKALCKDQEWAA